ncbi:MAG: GH92 family glycosyl hydrolase [Bacteroidales bacterium]|nr:GH92 family glycosyl hydrolase [Bacteroidales bacterium]
MSKSGIATFLILTTFFCKAQSPAWYVNPFIGTNEMGHTYPGATVPFGMVQLSPETDTIQYSIGQGYIKDVYRYCAGYQYSDKTIVGFSHTHFSGTGHSDLGDFLVMPTTGNVQLNPGTANNPESGYRSRFSHETEKASAGYYSVMLSDYNIKAELTTSARVGFHRYTFPETSEANIILDMVSGIYNYDGKVVWSSVRVENDTLITGYRQTQGWARDRTMYFAMVFSKPIRNYGCRDEGKVVYNDFYRKFNTAKDFPEMSGRKLKTYFSFDTKAGEQILIKFALSAVSTEGAVKNLKAEIPHWNFDLVHQQAEDSWNKELSRITIEASEEKKIIFYTALYHSFLSPTLLMDVDGQYRGLDHNNHLAEGFTNYTTFSLWDTYRALHPLFTLVQQNRTSDMINSMLAHQQQSVHHILPVWSHYSNENWCMIGYHAASVITDAYMKGITGFNAQKALDACISSATYAPNDGIGDYMKYGYVPADKSSNSASKTLEYAYDDYCISKMAGKMGKQEIASTYAKRSEAYNFVWDNNTGFMRAKKSDGTFQSPFDPLSTERQGFIEGNAWNYSFYIPQNPARLIELYGGNKKFMLHLDSLFDIKLDEKYFAESEDISAVGMIGNYVHGNEPSHHVPYLYVFAGAPWKTQERIHQIVNTMYHNTTEGLCGNDDCGQMSAWYIFSSLGFYPVCPGSNEYVIGAPSVDKATLNLENGKQFSITAPNLNDKNIYVQQIILNGIQKKDFIILHDDIMKGGTLEFVMGSKPKK